MFRDSSADDLKHAMDEARFRDLVAAAPGADLARCARRELSDEQWGVIRAVFAYACAEGLTIPADLPIEGVLVEPGSRRLGQTNHNQRSGRLVVYLHVRLQPKDFASIVFHEVFHVSRRVQGVAQTDDEEDQADRFAARMMAKWWPTLSRSR